MTELELVLRKAGKERTIELLLKGEEERTIELTKLIEILWSNNRPESVSWQLQSKQSQSLSSSAGVLVIEIQYSHLICEGC